MKTLLLIVGIGLISPCSFAQPNPASASAPTPGPDAGEAGLATRTGHEVSVGLSKYTYTEPGSTSISIHGAKLAGEYTGTLSLGELRRWFVRADVRGTAGSAAYDGWCSPYQITPNSASPNGYQLDLGDSSPCSESGDRDWYLETRGLVGRDLIGDKWAWSPHAGLGFRHLSNGTTGVPGFRTDEYLYVPLGATVRTKVAANRTLSFDVEYDQLIHGWQTTRDSRLGGGNVPATPTAPPFTINGFSDVSFSQHGGWALRASVYYPFTHRLSVEPSYIYWHVSASPVSDETATFTVNNVTAQEQLGFYEPLNHTHEFSVKVGFHF